MAKKSMILKNEKRIALAAKYAEKRAALTAVVKDPNAEWEDKVEALAAIAKLPRNSAPSRIRNRCVMTGRPRAYYRKFGLSRIALREEALKGNLPGVTKASW